MINFVVRSSEAEEEVGHASKYNGVRDSSPLEAKKDHGEPHGVCEGAEDRFDKILCFENVLECVLISNAFVCGPVLVKDKRNYRESLEHELPADSHVFVGLNIHDPPWNHGSCGHRVEQYQPGDTTSRNLLKNSFISPFRAHQPIIRNCLLLLLELEELCDVHAEACTDDHFLCCSQLKMFLVEVPFDFFLLFLVGFIF